MSISSISISHGSGKGLQEILNEIIHPILTSGHSGPYEDAAIIPRQNGRLGFTTDAFVVNPLEFPGGDIGKLSVCGTVNDLACMGAMPLQLSVALVLEEGLDAKILKRILESLRKTADSCGITIGCGDTKVVEKGKADGIFITTSGVGVIKDDIHLSSGNAKIGDRVIVSGDIGRHGIAIMASRGNLGFASEVTSDCAALHELIKALLDAVPNTKTIRDATRGGVAAVLNEIGQDSGVTLMLNQQHIPVADVTRGACDYLGMEPIQVANEGRFVAVVPKSQTTPTIKTLNRFELGKNARVIGMVQKKSRFPLLMKTDIGGTRPVEVPPGQLLPRIC